MYRKVTRSSVSVLCEQICGDTFEMRDLAARICKDYLNGPWKNVTAQNIGFKHISGGLSNWLYHIWLPGKKTSSSVPNQVLVRVYGQTHGGDGQRALEALLTESVVFTLLSERGLGPRLHGVFPGGRIEEYIPARPLRTSELRDPILTQHIARKMAQIHGMDVPLSKEPRWLWDTLQRWQKSAEKALCSTSVPECAIPLQAKNWAQEIQQLQRLVANTSSPVVFCHNDFQEGNILLKESSTPSEPEIVLIDFEYCSYNYRGFDLANHFVEWTYDYTYSSPPYYLDDPNSYPTQEQQIRFLTAYLEEIGSTQNPRDLLPEIRVFSLASHLFWGLWAIVNANTSNITFGYWEYAASRLGSYLKLKQDLQNHSGAVKRKLDEEKMV